MSPILTVGPVARAKNGVIGRGGDLPWRLSSDLKMFKRLTLGKPVMLALVQAAALDGRPLRAAVRDKRPALEVVRPPFVPKRYRR